MAVAFLRGSTTGPNDLTVTVRDSSNNLIDPYRLEYAVFDYTTGMEVLIGSPSNTPLRISTGQYYADVVIAADANIGLWRIRWTIQETALSPVYQSVQEFQVVGSNIIPSFTGDSNFDALIHSLRIMLRDNNPDRNYHFRPPASEKFIQGQTQVFGFIWEDEELVEYLYMAVDDFNSRPPTTGIEMSNLWGGERRWRTTIILRAASFACFAISMNWIADEFSVHGDEMLTVKDKNGNLHFLTIKELFEILYEINTLNKKVKEEFNKALNELNEDKNFPQIVSQEEIKENEEDVIIRESFKEGNLKIRSMIMDDDLPVWSTIENVLRHNTPHKRMFRITTMIGESIVTEDHSLFLGETREPVEASDLKVGMNIVGLIGDRFGSVAIIGIEETERQEYTYDVAIPGVENALLDSGILVHNSYSISGVSLDIEKSSKYQSMKDQYINEYDKLVEANKRSIKIIKGLRQSKWGIGLSSALGPMSRPGVQSRRNLIAPGSGYL